MNIRAVFAIFVCKALKLVSKILRRGGTAMPGRWALKICPDLLKRLGRDVQSVAVTGTNGKTTSSRMIEKAFAVSGSDYFSNRSGANLISGIVTDFVMNCNLGGKMKKHHAVIECDEAAAVRVFEQMQPAVIVVTNLFRDQMDRFGEVTHTLDTIKKAVSGAPDAVLCLNADCSLTASVGDGLPNRVVYYGVNPGASVSKPLPDPADIPRCVKCRSEFEYSYVSYGHLGSYRCPVCGYERPAADVAVTKVSSLNPDNSEIRISFFGEERDVTVNLPAMYNVYNAAASAAAAVSAGLGIDNAIAALSGFECGFGRMETFPRLGSAGGKMMLVKNPAGCNQVLDFLSAYTTPYVLTVAVNDHTGDGTDISWIWDAEFETLVAPGSQLSHIYVSGDRANDVHVRLKYAGFSEDMITVEKDYDRLVPELKEQTLPVCIMPTYSAMLDMRSVIVKYCGGSEFWES